MKLPTVFPLSLGASFPSYGQDATAPMAGCASTAVIEAPARPAFAVRREREAANRGRSGSSYGLLDADPIGAAAQLSGGMHALYRTEGQRKAEAGIQVLEFLKSDSISKSRARHQRIKITSPGWVNPLSARDK